MDVISVFNLTEAQIIDLITKCYQLITDRNKKTVMQLRIELDAMQAKVTKLMNTEAGLARILENTQKREAR